MHGMLFNSNVNMWQMSLKGHNVITISRLYKNIKHNYKTIFSIANGLLFRKQESLLPPISPISKLAEGFSKFFFFKLKLTIL